MKDQLGKYTIIRRLGIGGMAEVFLCRLHGIGGFEKHVVVKRIRADVANDSEFVTMFFDEARLAANLSHPNVIQIFEVDVLDGAPYISMEFVKGPTLSTLIQHMRRHNTAPEYAHLARIFADACAGLDYAHNAEDAGGRPLQIVHRDISPQNIIITLDGTPKIFDFGVAKARGSLASTGTDRVKGKFAYMAPEQLRAQPVDGRADVYALGVCLYEVTVGKRPFVADTEAELFAARMNSKFHRPSEIDPMYPVELEHIVMAAMWPEAEGRPTAVELRERLLAFAIAHEGASAWRTTSAWLRELFPGETADAYESYSSSPTLTPIPQSNQLPTSNAVEPRRRWRLPLMVVAGGVLVTAGVTIGALAVREPTHIAPPNTAVVMDQAGRNESWWASAIIETRTVKREPDAATAGAAKPVRSEPAPPREPATPGVRPGKDRTVPTRTSQGVLSIDADPAATVLVNGATIGKGARIWKGDAGRHTVEVRLGARRRRDVVTIKSGETTQVALSLPPVVAAVGGGAAETPPDRSDPPPPTNGTGSGPGSSAAVTQPITPIAPSVPRVGALDAVPTSRITAVDGGFPPSELEEAVGRKLGAFRECYRAAARAKQQTPALKITLAFQIDEQRSAHDLVVRGDTLGVAACIKASAQEIRTRHAPDVGTVGVTAIITFKPT